MILYDKRCGEDVAEREREKCAEILYDVSWARYVCLYVRIYEYMYDIINGTRVGIIGASTAAARMIDDRPAAPRRMPPPHRPSRSSFARYPQI